MRNIVALIDKNFLNCEANCRMVQRAHCEGVQQYLGTDWTQLWLFQSTWTSRFVGGSGRPVELVDNGFVGLSTNTLNSGAVVFGA